MSLQLKKVERSGVTVPYFIKPHLQAQQERNSDSKKLSEVRARKDKRNAAKNHRRRRERSGAPAAAFSRI